MNQLNIDSSWCLFLDRDGVINKRIMGGYVKHRSEFEFLPHVLGAIAEFSKLFQHIFIVTNQQGIGKGIMNEEDLKEVHQYMLETIHNKNGKISQCYFAPGLAGENNSLRKPNIGMGLQAKQDFPELDFTKSIMVGDSDSDIQFGMNLGMKTVRIKTVSDMNVKADYTINNLFELTTLITYQS